MAMSSPNPSATTLDRVSETFQRLAPDHGARESFIDAETRELQHDDDRSFGQIGTQAPIPCIGPKSSGICGPSPACGGSLAPCMEYPSSAPVAKRPNAKDAAATVLLCPRKLEDDLQRECVPAVPRQVDLATAPKVQARRLPKPFLRLDAGALGGENHTLQQASVTSRSAPLQDGSMGEDKGRRAAVSPRKLRLGLLRLHSKRFEAPDEPVPSRKNHVASSRAPPVPHGLDESSQTLETSNCTTDADTMSPLQKQELLAALGEGLATSPIKCLENLPSSVSSSATCDDPSPMSLEAHHGHKNTMHQIMDQIRDKRFGTNAALELDKPPKRPWIHNELDTGTRHPRSRYWRLREIEEEISRLYLEWMVVGNSP